MDTRREGVVENLKFQGVVEWLRARKPWVVTAEKNEDCTIVKAEAKSLLSGRTCQLGFVVTKEQKFPTLEMLDALDESMAQALAGENDKSFECAFTEA